MLVRTRGRSRSRNKLCGMASRPVVVRALLANAFTLLTSISAGAQVDQQLAERLFRETAQACARDGGRLWGVSICGPMVIADPATKTIASSQPVPPGEWPAVLGYVGAPLEWGGARWGTYAWDLLRTADDAARLRIMLHELFHRVQPELKLMTVGMPNDHIDTLAGRYWLQLEWRALARALTATGSERVDAIRDAIAFRGHRRSLFPGSAENERAVELREGLAEYTANVVGATTPADAVAYAVRLVTDTQNAETSFVGGFGYRLGAAYGLLLDSAAPGWTRRITQADDLGQLLTTALKIQPTPDTMVAAVRYDASALRLAEERRDAEQQSRIADLKRRFVDSPVLIMPRARSVALNGSRTSVPGVGMVFFGGYRTTTDWGRLESTDAILESSDGETLRLPAPVRTDGAMLSGNGWTITLATGWVTRPGPRSGDVRIVRGSN